MQSLKDMLLSQLIIGSGSGGGGGASGQTLPIQTAFGSADPLPVYDLASVGFEYTGATAFDSAVAN